MDWVNSSPHYFCYNAHSEASHRDSGETWRARLLRCKPPLPSFISLSLLSRLLLQSSLKSACKALIAFWFLLQHFPNHRIEENEVEKVAGKIRSILWKSFIFYLKGNGNENNHLNQACPVKRLSEINNAAESKHLLSLISNR